MHRRIEYVPQVLGAISPRFFEPSGRPTSRQTTAYVELVGVGDPLPDMPAYLDVSGWVPVPLEATYQAAWATCPADLRELVETGKLSGEGD